MKFIYNWKEAWKWFSVQVFTVIMILPSVWASIPDDAKAFLPDGWGSWVLTTLAACGILGRIIDQKK